MKKRLVILGGGLVGAFAARLLAKQPPSETEIVLLSPTDHLLFPPLLIELLAGDITKTQCTHPFEPWAQKKGIRFIQGKGLAVQREQHQLRYEDTQTHLQETLAYDILVFAQGGTTNFFGTPGATEHAYPLKSCLDVTRIQEQVRTLLKSAQGEPEEDRKRAILTMGVAGGGPAGIEAVCSLRHYARSIARKEAPELLNHLTFFVVEAAPDILPGFPDNLRLATKQELYRQGIDLYTSEAVTSVTAHSVTTAERAIPTSLLLWTAGVTPNIVTITPPFDEKSPTGLPLLKETVVLDDHHFTSGDAVTIEWHEKRLPKNGQLAMQFARHLADQIRAQLEKRPVAPFTPKQAGLFLGMVETGFFSTGTKLFQQNIINRVRQCLYRFRLWQIL